MLKLRTLILFLLTAVATTITLNAQQTIVKGVVIDSETSEKIPFVNIIFKGTTIGTTSDLNGLFKLETYKMVDSLSFSAVGYHPRDILIQNSIINEVTIKLIPENIYLNEVNVLPDDVPIRALFKKIVDNKKNNNPEKFDRYNYEKYTKWEYHLDNVNDRISGSLMLDKENSLLTNDSTQTRYLPIYFSEQIVKNEFQRKPLKQKSTVIADKTSGLGLLEDMEISGYTSGLDIEINFYDNYINLFTQNFVSPIANNGWQYYKYYLADSSMVGNTKIYKVKFNPRRIGDKVFSGYFTIDDKYYSIISMNATLANTSNINFLQHMRLESSYQMINDSLPFYKTNLIEASINYLPLKTDPEKKHLEFDYTQTSNFSKVKFDDTTPIEFNSKGLSYESIKLKGAYNRDSNYWANARPIELTDEDYQLSKSIDASNQLFSIRLINKAANMHLSGFFDVGKVEIGPYNYLFNFNEVEGTHLFLGGRTSTEISENWLLWGGVGYGTKNEQWLGRIGVGYKFNHPKRRVFKFFYSDDIVRIGENEKILYLYENMLSSQENNLVSNLFQHDKFDELFHQKRVSLTYENEWYNGFSSKFKVNFNQHFSPDYYPFIYQSNTVDHINNLEGDISFRWSKMEKFVDKGFLRLHYSSDYPIINLNLGGGIYDFADTKEYYGKVHTTIKHLVNLQQGYFNYAIEAGMYFGKLPYTMLEVPRGNETFGYYNYDFNMMNYVEFVHDQYIHTYLEYHLDGFFFNRIPLLKRLGLREVASAKGMLGRLSDKQLNSIDLPLSISPENNKPYLEVGAGIENILRFIRLEAVWRLTHQNTLLAPEFGLRAKVEIKL